MTEVAPGNRLFDCHCHLQSPEFDTDRDQVIERAIDAGVARVLAVAEDLADGERVLALADRCPDFVVPALGAHPDRAAELSDSEVVEIMATIRANADRLGAVGEVGLDFRPCWDDAARDRQREMFRAMVQLALELDLPLSVHSRSAGRHAIDLLLEEGATAACLHAFDGRAVHAERAAAAGLVFSLPPSIVRSRVKQKLAPRLPGDAVLLESDSPVLGPSAGARNEPANLVVGLRTLAELREESEGALRKTIEDNTRRIFPRLVEGARQV